METTYKEICSILSLCLCVLGIFVMGVPFELTAIILSILGIQSKQKGLSVLSIITLVMSVILFLVCMFAIALTK